MILCSAYIPTSLVHTHMSYVCGISLPHVLNAKKWVDVGAGLHVCSEVDQSLFTCRSRCCFLFLFITWLEERLSTPALSKSSIIARWRTRALTLHTAVLSGTSYGVALAPFSCALWVAVHPNIPCPREREAKNYFQKWIRNPLLSFAEHRLLLFVCALLVPEYVLAWAIRQYLTARKIASENEGELDTL